MTSSVLTLKYSRGRIILIVEGEPPRIVGAYSECPCCGTCAVRA